MIYLIFATHWCASVFFQSFFLHRYAASVTTQWSC